MTDDPARALEAILKLTALEERSGELKASLERIEEKLGVLVERLSKVEAKQEELDRLLLRSTQESPAATEDPLSRTFLTTTSEE